MWRKWGAPNPKGAAVLLPHFFLNWPVGCKWWWGPTGRRSPRMEGPWIPQENWEPPCNVCLGFCLCEKYTSFVLESSYVFEFIYFCRPAYPAREKSMSKIVQGLVGHIQDIGSLKKWGVTEEMMSHDQMYIWKRSFWMLQEEWYISPVSHLTLPGQPCGVLDKEEAKWSDTSEDGSRL